MFDAIAKITQSLVPVFSWVREIFAHRRIRKEARSEAERDFEDMERDKAETIAENRRALESKIEANKMKEKERVAKEGPGNADDRLDAISKKTKL